MTQEEAALRIQRIARGMIARRQVGREAEAEEVFIGMRLAVRPSLELLQVPSFQSSFLPYPILQMLTASEPRVAATSLGWCSFCLGFDVRLHRVFGIRAYRHNESRKDL